MFLAQMQNQDPLNPMDGQEFAAQLAQFSSVEQLYNVNDSLEDLKALQQDGSQYEVLSLIGREIIAVGDEISLGGEEGAMGGFDLAEDAQCSVVITDETGASVRHLSLGNLEAGRQEFEWDGENDSGTALPEGVYQFTVTATARDGSRAITTPHIVGQVDRINLEGETSTLYVGDVPVKLSSILDIRSAGVETSSEETGGDSTGQDVGV
jgi:flagellar basal-body rod modification protein FlgD